MRHIFEVQVWRGLGGAVLCETRDFRIKWPKWHTLTFEGQVQVDMRDVCPKDVKNMLLKQARTTYWKKCAAKQEYEESKEGFWLEPTLALLRKIEQRRVWTDKVARKLVLEEGWVQKRLFDIGSSNDGKCQACHKEEGTEKHRVYHCPEGNEARCEIPEALRKWEQKVRTSKMEWKWQRGIVTHPLSEKPMEQGPFQYEKVGI